MKVYYYHTSSVEERYRQWKEGNFPGHGLYGLTHLERNGCQVVIFPYRYYFRNRVFQSLNVLLEVLFCREKYDVFYGTSQIGIEALIFFRALGIYRKPIAVLHHAVVRIPRNRVRRFLSDLFYKGIDKLFFFSDELMTESLQSGKVKNASSLHWGADLEYYNRFVPSVGNQEYFISTGCENRDLLTLVNAFDHSEMKGKLKIYLPEVHGFMNYKQMLEEQHPLPLSRKIDMHWLRERIPFGELVPQVQEAMALMICCVKWKYVNPVGLSSLVEAMALGKAIITTDNPYYGIDVEKEGIGIKVLYGDVDDWIAAVNHLREHPEIVKEMGDRAKRLACKSYNLELFGKELCEELCQLKNKGR